MSSKTPGYDFFMGIIIIIIIIIISSSSGDSGSSSSTQIINLPFVSNR